MTAGLALGALLSARKEAPAPSALPPSPAAAATIPPRPIYETPRREESGAEHRLAPASPSVAGWVTGRTLAGSGSQVTAPFRLDAGSHYVELMHTGAGNFAIGLADETGRRTQWLASGQGVHRSSRVIHVERSGLYVLNVTASGAWAASIDQPAALEQRAPRPTETPTPEDGPSTAGSERERWERELQSALEDYAWWSQNGYSSGPNQRSKEAARRANEAARQLGRSLPFPDEN